MPNWCENRVEIYGEPEEITAIKELVTSNDSDFDFNKILPMPKALEDTTKGSNHVPSEELKEKYGFDNWYDWRIHNWGTKWDAASDDIYSENESDDYLLYTFETAWAPPEGILHELRSKFPDVSVTWFFDEPGVQIAGYL